MINKNNRTYDEIVKDDENKVLFKRYVPIDFESANIYICCLKILFYTC